MHDENPEHEPIPFIRELCQHKSEEEIREAEENFRGYLAIVKRISDRIVREKVVSIDALDKQKLP